jgi:hypothetical protein
MKKKLPLEPLLPPLVDFLEDLTFMPLMARGADFSERDEIKFDFII